MKASVKVLYVSLKKQKNLSFVINVCETKLLSVSYKSCVYKMVYNIIANSFVSSAEFLDMAEIAKFFINDILW